jgi:hypothetical protein
MALILTMTLLGRYHYSQFTDEEAEAQSGYITWLRPYEEVCAFLFFFNPRLWIEPRSLNMLGKCSTTKLHFQPRSTLIGQHSLHGRNDSVEMKVLVMIPALLSVCLIWHSVAILHL